MPTTPGCQPSPATTIAPWAACGSAAASAAEQDAGLGVLAVAVEQVELARDLAGAAVVLGEQQLQRGVGALHAPGGVDARAEPEAERVLGELGRLHAGDLHQRAQAGLRGARERDQPLADDAAVLAAQRDEVADGGERGEVEVLLGCARDRRPCAECSASLSLSATPAAHSSGQARRRERRVDERRSRAAASPGRWWSVTTTSRPAARAAATCSTAVMPQSTVTSRSTPRAASRSTATVDRP